MKRFFYAAAVLFAAVSCGKNGLYINVDNTVWEYTTDTQTAWVDFLDGERAGIIGTNGSNYQTNTGTFTVDGHRVLFTSEDGFSNQFVRTFSHLKNSKNKNYWTKSPEAIGNPKGSVWAAIVEGNLQMLYLADNGYTLEGSFKNVSHKEGIPYGWSWKQKLYSTSGSRFVHGDEEGTSYGGFIRLPDYCIPCVNTPKEDAGFGGDLAGTVWTYETSGYPGFIIFTSNTEFTRVLVSSVYVFSVLNGTYSIKGNSLEFITDSEELNRTCRISDGRFTYLEKTYSKAASF